MSTATLTPTAGDFGDWDDFLKFATLTQHLTLDVDPDFDGLRRPKRPARGAEQRAAIDESLREA
ncbi:hypothetical protein ACIA5D_36595 [Actinoplanes sp. NPDC051513]|uniref:hypothetical protein n=1 Tax=Actinoplanes sp. NPDC051513 TaxID=3363908 RepID=UPI0037A67441